MKYNVSKRLRFKIPSFVETEMVRLGRAGRMGIGNWGIPPAKWEKCEQMVGLSFFNRAKTCETRRFTRVSIGMKLEKL